MRIAGGSRPFPLNRNERPADKAFATVCEGDFKLMITFKVILAIAILFTLNFAASAQDKADSGRTPTETVAQATAASARCTSEQSGFRAQNGVNMYYVEVTSACARRQLCTINAYVVGSRGGKTGQGTLTLGKASPGQETKKIWTMRTAENGGMANMSWSCKDI